MFQAGINVREDVVRNLALQVDDDQLAAKLQRAVVRETKVLALEFAEHETILRAHVDAPEGLEQLRAVLLQEHVWRQHEGLSRPGRGLFVSAAG